jgi:signal transduction histidine kinase
LQRPAVAADNQQKIEGMMPRSMRTSSRRYALGAAAVALLGITMLFVYVLWSDVAIGHALETSVEARARLAAEAYRDKLTRALGGRDPGSSRAWAILDVTLEDAFQGLPDLVGVVVRLPDGSTGAVIGPPQIQRLGFLGPPSRPGGIDVTTEDAGGDRPRATASFLVPQDAPPSAAAQANLHLQFAPLAELRSGIFMNFQIGASLVVLVIYLLAALAWVIGRRGARAENLEREKAVRLRAIGDVAGAIAHELRNPLNAISLSFQVIGETLKGGDVEAPRTRDLERARGEVAKISRVVDNFVSFARLSDMTVTEFELAAVVREAFDALAPECAEASVRAEFIVTGTTTMRGDRDKIGEAVATTLRAVFEAVRPRPGGLDVQVVGRRREVELRIRGFGQRVDSRRISNFAASRRSWEEPMGLGLTIARTWIDLHGGRVGGSEPSADRAELTIVLPRGFV